MGSGPVDRHGIKLDYQYAQSETKSAFTPGRELFNKLVRDIEAGRVNAIAAIHANRIARNPVDAGIIINLLDRKKLLAIVTPSKIYHPNSTDKMMLAIEFIFSKKDSDDKSDFVKGGQRTKAGKGYPHGLAALGFINDKSEEKGNRKWLVDEVRLPIVKHLLDEFLTGTWSAGRLSKYAREILKLTTPQHKRMGGALITPSRIHLLLRDPIYAGFFYYDGQRWELNPSLPRLITEAQHEKIKRILSSKNIPKIKNHVLTYTGFIKSPKGEFIGQDVKSQVICDCKHKFSYSNKEKCPKCGRIIEELSNPKYLEYLYYYNVSRKKQGLKAHTVSEGEISDYVLDYFTKNLELSSELLSWSRKYIRELKDDELETKIALADQENNKIEDAKKRKQNVIKLMADGNLSGEDGKATLDNLNKIINSEVNGRYKEPDWFQKAMEITDLIEEFAKIMKSDDVSAKRRTFAKLGSNLTWNEEMLNIINTKWIDVLIEGLSEVKSKKEQFEPNIGGSIKQQSVPFGDGLRPMLCDQGSNLGHPP